MTTRIMRRSKDPSFMLGIVPTPTAEQRSRAMLLCAARAHGRDDLAELLVLLGLVEPPSRPEPDPVHPSWSAVNRHKRADGDGLCEACRAWLRHRQAWSSWRRGLGPVPRCGICLSVFEPHACHADGANR